MTQVTKGTLSWTPKHALTCGNMPLKDLEKLLAMSGMSYCVPICSATFPYRGRLRLTAGKPGGTAIKQESFLLAVSSQSLTNVSHCHFPPGGCGGIDTSGRIGQKLVTSRTGGERT